MRLIVFFLLCRMIIAGITSSGALKLIEMSEPGIVGRLISSRINPAENNNKNGTRKAVYFANTSLNGSSFAVNFNAVKVIRSEEHTSELQSRFDLVCRLLLEKKKITKSRTI